MKIAKAPTDEDHGYLFIYVGMEYIFSKAAGSRSREAAQGSGRQVIRTWSTPAQSWAAVIKTLFQSGNIKSRKQKPWDGDIIGTKRKNNSQNDDNGWAFVEDMVSQEMSNRQDIL